MNLQSELQHEGAGMPLLELEEQSGGEAEPFEFRSIRAPQMVGGRGSATPGANDLEREAGFRQVAEQARREGYEAGKRDGEVSGRADAMHASQAALERERANIAKALEEFRESREQYFASFEGEVVKLALSIAKRVLHREVQMDPLLLTTAVRVALEKMADRTGVTLHVPATTAGAWEQHFSSMDSHERPVIVSDESLAESGCFLETRMGTVDLGIPVQLEEIERGFFDLLQHRPMA